MKSSDIIISILAFILSVTMTMTVIQYLNNERGGAGISVEQSKYADDLAFEISQYEETFDVILPPINLYETTRENSQEYFEVNFSNITGYYIEGSGIIETNPTGGLLMTYKNASIIFLESDSWEEMEVKRVLVHELCHHYLRSVCCYSNNYCKYDCMGDNCPEVLTSQGRLPLELEEAFCEGYAISKTNWIRELVDPMYMTFKYYPRSFFEDGFESCDIYQTYFKYTGKEWE